MSHVPTSSIATRPIKVLVVDDDPKHLKLMKVYLPSFVDNVEVDVAPHPEDAVKIIESKKDPYPIIWSDHNFNNSRINGLSFLAMASKLSPLSSRLLCSANFPEYEMIELVRSGALQTYATKPFISGQVSDAIKIGIEYHKVNVLGEFIDSFEMQSTDDLEESMMNVGVVQENIGLDDNEFKIDFKNREEELKQLLIQNEVVARKFSNRFSKPLKIVEGLNRKINNEETIKFMEQVKLRLDEIRNHLLQNEILISKIIRRSSHEFSVNKTEFHINQIRKKYGLEEKN